MTKLRFALFGAGFWARYQLAAWRELPDVECVALYNRSRARGEKFARDFGIPAVYDDPAKLLANESLDFVDVCTHPFTLAAMVKLVAERGLPVISQKPMAPNLATARENLRVCRAAGVPYFIHENWRWQPQLRALRAVLASGVIGEVFRARLSMVSGLPVFTNEPHLRDLEEFILTDMGTHLFDLARFYFGEASQLYCQVHRVNPGIMGEDVATTMLLMNGGRTTVTVELGYPQNHLEHEAFPQTFAFIEGAQGSVELTKGYRLRTTTASGTKAERFAPVHYAWADTDYDVVHASIVACNANFLAALRGEGSAETTAEDNFKTLELVYACYDSARSGGAVSLPPLSPIK
jgi:predicted dehydrogenase